MDTKNRYNGKLEMDLTFFALVNFHIVHLFVSRIPRKSIIVLYLLAIRCRSDLFFSKLKKNVEHEDSFDNIIKSN
jgi:hypothetical protein